MNSHKAAELTGLSVRTLRYYDAIGLLHPARNPENGYREYCENDLDRLQQILFFRECGFPLSVIRERLQNPDFDREQSFQLQRDYLLREKKRIETMLDTLMKTHKSWKGEIAMTQKEKFAGFDFSKNPYEQEARRLWGADAVDQSSETIRSLSPQDQKDLAEQMDRLFEGLAQLRRLPPDSPQVLQEMAVMHRFFNCLGYEYSPEAFAGLGQLYECDERFTQNIDQYGNGLSAFLAKAMKHYADTLK